VIQITFLNTYNKFVQPYSSTFWFPLSGLFHVNRQEGW
jgi:hypothetical protein